MAFSSYLVASTVTMACFASKFTWTCLTHGKDVSAFRTSAVQPMGQVIPDTATISRFVDSRGGSSCDQHLPPPAKPMIPMMQSRVNKTFSFRVCSLKVGRCRRAFITRPISATA